MKVDITARDRELIAIGKCPCCIHADTCAGPGTSYRLAKSKGKARCNGYRGQGNDEWAEDDLIARWRAR